MKKALLIFLIVLFNLFLFAVSAVVHTVFVDPLERALAGSYSGLSFILLCIMGLIYGVYLATGPNDKRKAASPGLFILSWVLLVWSLLLINKKFAFHGHFETFKLRNVYRQNERATMNIEFDDWSHYVQVDEDKSIEVDSVNARIDRGLLGLKFYSDAIEIKEKKYCEAYTGPDASNFVKKYTDAAGYYTYRRCFEQAIAIYSDSIQRDSLHHLNYLKRGDLYLVRSDYRKAEKDFCKGAYLLYRELGEGKIEELKQFDEEKEIEELSEKLNAEDYTGILPKIENLDHIEMLKYYCVRINFCKTKTSISRTKNI